MHGLVSATCSILFLITKKAKISLSLSLRDLGLFRMPEFHRKLLDSEEKEAALEGGGAEGL
jgi:hypothetical protein